MAFDIIVIGSGFGGAITACRLAQSGRSVLVLERGRRWDKTNFPRKPEDPWIWDHDHPESENGWLDLRVFPAMSVAAGAGVGGGSLIYANISCEAPRSVFDTGWPAEITYAQLKEHYDAVAEMMDVRPVPDNQWTARMRLMKDAADAAGFGDRFRKLDLAVNFDPHWTYADFARGEAASTEAPNKHGALQGTCVHLGYCDIGCSVYAKNTLDRNYLYVAENKHAAEVRCLHLVDRIEPLPDGTYRVSFDVLQDGQRIAGCETARIVIVAAGSLGSTELLLRCRDVHGTLPNLSPFLGRNWSGNGDFLTPAFYDQRSVDPDQGPTIAAAIDFEDRSQGGQAFWIEDGGLPNLLAGYLQRKAQDPTAGMKAKLLIDALRIYIRTPDSLRNVMPWFAQGVDAGNGTLQLTERTLFCDGGKLHLNWNSGATRAVIDAIIAMHQRLSSGTGGTVLVPPTWSLFRDLATPHPLGGCNMGDTAADGVVDFAGRVFGYPNLYVADAAIIPRPLGVNPSRTIGALAEHIAAVINAG